MMWHRRAYMSQAQRNILPIAAYRNEIVMSLQQHNVLVLSGETGWSVICISNISTTDQSRSGKSTQLPSFLLEDALLRRQYCNILVTEPRRISALSLAQRVSLELGESPGAVGSLESLIGYAIRLESKISKTTRLTFATNGVALRMLEQGKSGGTSGFDQITVRGLP